MRSTTLALLALLLAAVAIACGSDVDTDAPPITASVLIETSASDAYWHRDVEVPKGTDGYELLEAAVEGELVAEWFGEYRSHFVTSIDGIAAEGSAFWGIFLWNESTPGWEPLPVGADLFSVKQDHVMAWVLVEYDPDNPQLPISTP